MISLRLPLQRFFVLVIIMCMIKSVSAQDKDIDKNKLADLRLLMKMGALSYQGKFREAIPVIENYLANLRAKPGKKTEDNVSYITWFGAEGSLYESIGNFTKAEQIFKQVMAEIPTLETEQKGIEHKQLLNHLSDLYEKMGNVKGEEAALEELIIIEYGYNEPLNEHDEVHDYYFKMYKKWYKNLDSLKLEKILKPVLNNYYAQQKSAGSPNNFQSRAALIEAAKKRFGFQPALKPVTADQMDQLRDGKLKLGSNSQNVNLTDSEDEVRRLFTIYLKQKNYAGAEALITQVANIYAKLDGPSGFTNTVMKMSLSGSLTSMLQKQYGLPADAAKNMNQILDANDYRSSIVSLKNNLLLVQLYKETGRTNNYRSSLDAIIRVCKTLATSSNPIILNDVAAAYAKIEKYNSAEILYKKLIANHKNTSGGKSPSPQIYMEALQQLSEIYRLQGEYSLAKSTLKLALDYDKQTQGEKYPEHLTRVINMAELYEATNELNTAEQYCNLFLGPVMKSIHNNFSFLSEQEKISLLNNQLSYFDFSASLLLTDPHPSADFINQTYNQQLQLKSLVLNNEEKVFREARASGNQSLKHLLSEWQSNKAAIAWQYSKPANSVVNHLIDSLTKIANDQEKKINQLSESFFVDNQNSQIGHKQVQQHLTTGEAAVEFVRFKYYHKKWTDSVWYAAFVTLPDNMPPHFVPLCEEKELANLLNNNAVAPYKLIKEIYGNTITPGNNAGIKKADSLYKIIWEPLTRYLKGVNKINIAPAGLLCRVAFNALPVNNSAYLIDTYRIRQYNSIREIAEQKTSHSYSGASNALLYGGIKFDMPDTVIAKSINDTITDNLPEVVRNSVRGAALDPLNGTLNEVTRISLLLKRHNKSATVITGAQATEESLKQLSGHSPWILHIATHGFSLPNEEQTPANPDFGGKQFSIADDPMFRSGIMMAGANWAWSGQDPISDREDGIVTAYEIADLDLSNTDLVVLSACETALGDIKGTEGVFGLQRAFKLAGVKNMLLSLWNIPDEETSELMELFYTGKIKGMTNYGALHSAQEVMRKKYAPYSWAAFELIE